MTAFDQIQGAFRFANARFAGVKQADAVDIDQGAVDGDGRGELVVEKRR